MQILLHRVKSSLKTALCIMCLFMTPSHALPGETVPELELKEYRIIGKDTRVFVITGDKRPTVNFTSFPLPLAEEERSRETSEGLITETERFRREEDFSMIRGISSSLDYTFGTRATNDLTVKASLDGSKTGFSLYTVNRAAKEHTPDNRAPLSQEAANRDPPAPTVSPG